MWMHSWHSQPCQPRPGYGVYDTVSGCAERLCNTSYQAVFLSRRVRDTSLATNQCPQNCSFRLNCRDRAAPMAYRRFVEPIVDAP
jgi:hypothetical protein